MRMQENYKHMTRPIDTTLEKTPDATQSHSVQTQEAPASPLPLLANATVIETPKSPGPADPAFVQQKTPLNVYIKLAHLVQEFQHTMKEFAEWQRTKMEGMEKEYKLCTANSTDALRSRGNWTLGSGILGIVGKLASFGFSAPGDRKIVDALADQLGTNNGAMHGLATSRIDARKGEADSRQNLLQTKLQKDGEASGANRELKEQLNRVLEEAKQAHQKASQPGQ